MKRRRFARLSIFAACATLLLWVRFEHSYARIAATMTPVEVRDETATLESQLVPPPGTALWDVESVYGKAGLIDPSKITKGDKKILHWIALLPAPAGREEINRAVLFMRVQDGKVVDSFISHSRTMNNRKAIGIPDLRSQRDIDAEKSSFESEARHTLEDLIEIQYLYADTLKTASWRPETEQTTK